MALLTELLVLFGVLVAVVILGACALRTMAHRSREERATPLEAVALRRPIGQQVADWESRGYGPAQAENRMAKSFESTVAVLTDPSHQFDVRIRCSFAGDRPVQTFSVVSFFPGGRLTTSSSVGMSLMPDEVVQSSFGSEMETLVDRHRTALESIHAEGVDPLELDPVLAMERLHDETESELAWLEGHPLRYVRATLALAGSLLHIREHVAPINRPRAVSRVARRLDQAQNT